jgi:tRNA-2-methylthio-N6-dimethylallyladenosine synthase
MLLGQNVNSYRSDIDFPTLLSRIAKIEGDFIIRFMTSHPKDATDALIDVMAEFSPKIAPFFHLPLQSGSNRILALMNRRYTRERYLEFARRIKERIPGIALSTDIIVGFPGETEEDFLQTLSILSEIEFDLVYAFIYSKREGTRAATYEDGLSREEKSERLGRLLKMQDEIYERKNSEYLHRTVRILIDSETVRDNKRIVTGKTDTSKPVHVESDSARVGEFIKVKITKASLTYLVGEQL